MTQGVTTVDDDSKRGFKWHLYNALQSIYVKYFFKKCLIKLLMKACTPLKIYDYCQSKNLRTLFKLITKSLQRVSLQKAVSSYL